MKPNYLKAGRGMWELSQADVARQLGKSVAWLSLLESREIRMTPEVARDLSPILRLPEEVLAQH